jgi:hypothetical protein
MAWRPRGVPDPRRRSVMMVTVGSVTELDVRHGIMAQVTAAGHYGREKGKEKRPF